MKNPKKELIIKEGDINNLLFSLFAAFLLLALIHLIKGNYDYNLVIYKDSYSRPDLKSTSNWLNYHCPLGVSHYHLSFDGYHGITPESFRNDNKYSRTSIGYKITASLSFALEGHWTFILITAILLFSIIKFFEKYFIRIK